MRRFQRSIFACAAALLAMLPLAGDAEAQNIGEWVDQLYYALTDQPYTQNWQAKVDLDFSSWDGGSENIPVVAAAVALVEDTDSFDIIPWWHTFLDCQNGNTCTVARDNLRFMTGAEQMSNAYNWSVMVSVATVNWWARLHGDWALQNKARVYLRKNFALYALAAGDGPALTYRHDLDKNNDHQPVDGGDGVYTDYCHMNIHGTNIWFDGPFLAMAGARSGQSWFCQDDRMPLMARAIAWPLTKNGRETLPQSSVLNYLQSTWPASEAENVYALDATARQIMRDQINFANQVPTMLWVLNNNGATRLHETMHFIGWNGARATLLESNPNGNKPGAVFGAKYTSSNQQAHMLYPWYGQFSGGYGRGYGKLLPTATSPTSAEAFGIVTVTMGLPAASPIYHVVLGPTFSAHQI